MNLQVCRSGFQRWRSLRQHLHKLPRSAVARLAGFVATRRTPVAVHALDALAVLLDGINAEGQGELAGRGDDISTAFALRRADILRSVPRHQVGAALAALAEAQRAALAAAARDVRAVIQGRQHHAKAERRHIKRRRGNKGSDQGPR